ncbi:hypothetical protein LQ327_01130 [Actinomycetospora endophytica]|uniref:TetR family transcriptional regulator n=1 Tax=Actinomycetospora endophytica TaxID=2291215 RepID=A0ABS8P161_9PSEU|nr:hypothetical protein [Actinomycetospora endophytica]MCD2191993.1 hypothetical protein [Actinomycetospora endophytica]
MPTPGRGRHQEAGQGACLMEYVSLLVGEAFSDRPTCTHPALAEFARGVNDRLSDDGRASLFSRAPVVATIGPRAPGVAAAVATAALADLGPDRPGGGLDPDESHLLQSRLMRLRRRDRPGRHRWGRHRDRIAARELIHVGLERTRRMPPGPARDRILLRLFDHALLAVPRTPA